MLQMLLHQLVHYVGCIDVYCALYMAQMLLCPFCVTYYCTGVIVHYLWPRCYWAIFFLFFFLFILLSNYFIFSSGMLNNILSLMCGRLYFPIFLLSVGLFTLMYIDSLIVLAKLLSSLPIILKFSMDVSWPLMFWCWNIGEGPSSVPCIFPQMFSLIHQCILRHSQGRTSNFQTRLRAMGRQTVKWPSLTFKMSIFCHIWKWPWPSDQVNGSALAFHLSQLSALTWGCPHMEYLGGLSCTNILQDHKWPPNHENRWKLLFTLPAKVGGEGIQFPWNGVLFGSTWIK